MYTLSGHSSGIILSKGQQAYKNKAKVIKKNYCFFLIMVVAEK